MQSERVRSEELDSILGKEFKMLDHGFIRVIDYMGNDSSIVQAARVSYGEGTKTVSEDASLIKYLMKHKHTSPFEMCEIKFHIKLPIFIARQWVRHRTASINEYSARYSILSKEFYIPEIKDLSVQSKNNKQGRANPLPEDLAIQVQEMLKQDATRSYENYEHFLSGEVNLARELARMNVTLNYYTEWYWKIDLHNFLHFLKLRIHPHAQFEIRVYAEKMLEIARIWCPFASAAFEEFIINSVTLSSSQIEVIKKMTKGDNIVQETSGLSKRDWNEIIKILK